MSAHDALMALAQDLVTEIATGMAIELAAGPAPQQPGQPRKPPLKGAAAVHPQLGQHLSVLPGDTISGLAYAHLQPAQPPGVQQGGGSGASGV